MKRIKFIIVPLFFIILLSGCGSNESKRKIPESDFEYTEYYSSMNTFNFNLCYRAFTHEDFEHITKSHGFNIDYYGESFFENKGLILYMISEGSSGYRHYLSFKINGEYIDYYYQRIVKEGVGYTCDMAYYLVCIEVDLDTLVNIKGVKGENSNNISMFDDEFETQLPKEMPDDFWIFISYGNTTFDSRTGKYWYNQKENDLVLTNEELQDIYQIFYNCEIDRYQGHIYLSEEKDFSMICISFNNITTYIHGYANITYDWFEGIKVYHAFEEVVTKYIDLEE